MAPSQICFTLRTNTFVKDFVICFGKFDFACFDLSNHIKISPTAETPKIFIILPIISQEEQVNLGPISWFDLSQCSLQPKGGSSLSGYTI